MPYVRENFFRGEDFVDLADAQRRVEAWCASTAGLRVHGTHAQRPAELFAAAEATALLPAPAGRYDVPIFATPKVARDHHVEVARGLYSVPGELIGQRVDVRADSVLVKIYSRGQLVKTHPRKPPGGRSTDPGDYPAGRAEYALRGFCDVLGPSPTVPGTATGGPGRYRWGWGGPAPPTGEDAEAQVTARRLRELQKTTGHLREATEQHGAQLASVGEQLQELGEQVARTSARHTDLAAAVSEDLAPRVSGLKQVFTEELGQLRGDVDVLLNERKEREKTKTRRSTGPR